MGTVKNAVYKVDNGTDFDEIHFKTNAEQVGCADGRSVGSHLAEKVNKSDFSSLKATNGWRKTTDGFIEQWIETKILVYQNSVGAINCTLPLSLIGKNILMQNTEIVCRIEGSGILTDSDIERIIASSFIMTDKTSVKIKVCDINNNVIESAQFLIRFSVLFF
ncbi:hypothetical protein [Clostridium sp.]|uniref:hypothetical protein n=1 Tax=Clostridium sp. TaxID=1506 RepID=UPI003216AE0E